VNNRERIHCMQGNASNGAGLLSGDKIVVIGVCIGNAATTGRYVVETALLNILSDCRVVPC
jgi:hypothetical protein